MLLRSYSMKIFQIGAKIAHKTCLKTCSTWFTLGFLGTPLSDHLGGPIAYGLSLVPAMNLSRLTAHAEERVLATIKVSSERVRTTRCLSLT